MRSPAAEERARKADRTLRALLRTPKTRAGLLAAVTGKGISNHFVFGWLAHKVATAEVTTSRESRRATYQLSKFLSVTVTTSVYPAWLDPRTLPSPGARRVFNSGTQINQTEEEK